MRVQQTAYDTFACEIAMIDGRVLSTAELLKMRNFSMLFVSNITRCGASIHHRTSEHSAPCDVRNAAALLLRPGEQADGVSCVLANRRCALQTTQGKDDRRSGSNGRRQLHNLHDCSFQNAMELFFIRHFPFAR